MRTQGRSSARGPTPQWIEAAADYTVELKPGSTVLELEVPTLFEAAPETFEQSELFPEIDPDRSSFDYLSESLAAAAVEGDKDSQLYDKGLLEVFRQLDGVFNAGATTIGFDDGYRMRLAREDIERLTVLESEIPEPQYVRVAGRLDTIRHSDRTFTILAPGLNQTVKGIAEAGAKADLQALWGKAVVVSGTAHFTPSGHILRIEADHIRAAAEGEESLWGKIPRPVGRAVTTAELRREQGPRSGLNAVFGRWPGEESDEEILAVLDEIS